MTIISAERQAAIDANLEKYDFKTCMHSPEKQGIYRVEDGVEVWFEKEITTDGEKFKHLIFAAWIDATIATGAQISHVVTEFRTALHYGKNKSEDNPNCYLESRGMVRQ